MLTKEVVVDKIEVLEKGHLQIRRATYILEDGIRISGPSYERIAYVPGSDISKEDKKVQDISAIAWTADVVQAYKDFVAANKIDFSGAKE